MAGDKGKGVQGAGPRGHGNPGSVGLYSTLRHYTLGPARSERRMGRGEGLGKRV